MNWLNNVLYIPETQRHHQNHFCNQFLLLSMRVLMTSLTYNVHILNIEGKLLNERNSPTPIDRAHRVVPEMGSSSSGLELTPEFTLFSVGVGVELEWNFENRDVVGVELICSGVGVELELTSFFQLQFNSGGCH